MHRTELEWLTDDPTTSFEDGFVHVQSIELRGAIDEIVDAGGRTTCRKVVLGRAGHGRIVPIPKARPLNRQKERRFKLLFAPTPARSRTRGFTLVRVNGPRLMYLQTARITPVPDPFSRDSTLDVEQWP
jgi:hypothetical protein